MKFKCVVPTFLKKADIKSSYRTTVSRGLKQGRRSTSSRSRPWQRTRMRGSRLQVQTSDGRSTMPHWQEVSDARVWTSRKRWTGVTSVFRVGPYALSESCCHYDRARRPVEGEQRRRGALLYRWSVQLDRGGLGWAAWNHQWLTAQSQSIRELEASWFVSHQGDGSRYLPSR